MMCGERSRDGANRFSTPKNGASRLSTICLSGESAVEQCSPTGETVPHFILLGMIGSAPCFLVTSAGVIEKGSAKRGRNKNESLCLVREIQYFCRYLSYFHNSNFLPRIEVLTVDIFNSLSQL